VQPSAARPAVLETSRTLANGDLLRIDAVIPKGLIVRRALDADPRTGQRRWTRQPFLYAGYQNAELGYAVTDHVAQGRTVTAGLAVIAGAEDRPHTLVALTRGTTINLAYVFTVSPKRADPVPGPRPALTRYDQAHTERIGAPAPAATPSAQAGEALAVLSAVLERDGRLLSASQDRLRAPAGADHLAILNAIWTAETTPARQQRYNDLLTSSLPPGYRREPGHQARWLWLTLRAAELAGLDPGQEFALWLSPHILGNARRVLEDLFKWEPQQADAYVAILSEAAEHSGGGLLTDVPRTVHDCPDHEDNPVLDLAAEVGAMLIVSNDTDLLSMVTMARHAHPGACRLRRQGRCNAAPCAAKATLRAAADKYGRRLDPASSDRSAEGKVHSTPGRGARRGASERRYQARSSDVQRLTQLVEPHPATLRDDRDFYGMQKVMGPNPPSSTFCSYRKYLDI
jgi:predicted nucleic acid-binding protein